MMRERRKARFAPFFVLLLMFVLSACSTRQNTPPAFPGSTGQGLPAAKQAVALDFSVEDFAGAEITLTKIRNGRPAIILFWGST